MCTVASGNSAKSARAPRKPSSAGRSRSASAGAAYQTWSPACPTKIGAPPKRCAASREHKRTVSLLCSTNTSVSRMTTTISALVSLMSLLCHELRAVPNRPAFRKRASRNRAALGVGGLLHDGITLSCAFALTYGLAHARDQFSTKVDGVVVWIEAANQERAHADVVVIEQRERDGFCRADESSAVPSATERFGDWRPQCSVLEVALFRGSQQALRAHRALSVARPPQWRRAQRGLRGLENAVGSLPGEIFR